MRTDLDPHREESERRDCRGRRGTERRNRERAEERGDCRDRREPPRGLPRDEREGEERAAPEIPQPRVGSQYLARADPDPETAPCLRRHVRRRGLPGDRVAGEEDLAAVSRDLRGQPEIVQYRAFRERRDELPPGRVDGAVRAEADPQTTLGLLEPALALPELGLRSRPRTGRGNELQAAADRADIAARLAA